MIRGNRTVIRGVVREKDQAQKEWNAAIAAGRTAALGEEQTKDVFSITVGNMGAQETVTINVTYLQTLVDSDSVYRARESAPQLRFTLPRAYLQRAGQAPTGKILPGVPPTNVPFTMKLSVKQWTKMDDCETPGYEPVKRWSPDEKSVTFDFGRSTSSRDVVAIITAPGLGKSRAMIEQHPSGESTAIAMTLVPTGLNSLQSSNMEYIAVVDQSSSMAGFKMELTRKALEELLNQLPQQGSYFNIVSFGEKVDSMWSQVRPYNTTEVWRAKSYIADMKADYGSTKQISKALSKAFDSLPSRLTRPVSIFLLTDGAAWDVHECISKTEAAIRERSTTENFLRVFTVGLGDGASTDTCDGIARAGRGMSTYIITPDQQTFLGQCKRLLAAARTLPVSDFNVRLSNPPPRPSVGPLPDIQQAPTDVPFLNGTRTSIFMIVPGRASGPYVQFKTSPSSLVPVTQRFEAFNRTGGEFFHTVAAKGIITELEDTYVSFPAKQAETKRDIVQYGTKFRLTSRFTSYVAIDDNTMVGIGAANIPKRSVMNGQTTVRLADPMPQPMAQALAPRVASSQVQPSAYRLASFEPEEPDSPVTFVDDSNVFGNSAQQSHQLDDPTAILSSQFSLQSLGGGFGTEAAHVKEGSHSFEIIYHDDVSEREKLNNRGTPDTVVVDSNVFTPPGNLAQQPNQPDDPTAILSSLSNLQNVDGGFGTKSADVMRLILPLSPSSAVQLLGGYNTNIVAALLAWLWMSVWGGIQAITSVERLNNWIRENANADLNVDDMQSELYEASSSTSTYY